MQAPSMQAKGVYAPRVPYAFDERVRTSPARSPLDFVRPLNLYSLTAAADVAMLHRRTNSTKRTAQDTSTSSSSNGAPAANTAYKPLRRESAQFYATPKSGQKARYNLPSPSPLQVGLGSPYATGSFSSAGATYSGNAGGYFGTEAGGYGYPNYGNTVDLGGSAGASGSKVGPDLLRKARIGIDWMRRGFEDAARVDKSVTLVWR